MKLITALRTLRCRLGFAWRVVSGRPVVVIQGVDVAPSDRALIDIETKVHALVSGATIRGGYLGASGPMAFGGTTRLDPGPRPLTGVRISER